MTTLGTRIRATRESRGLKQTELAAQINVSAAVLSNWEQDINKPNTDKLATLCQALVVSPSFLLDYRDPQNVSPEEYTFLQELRSYDEVALEAFGKFRREQQTRLHKKESATGQSPDRARPFLNETDIDYAAVKSLCAELPALKKKSYRTYEDITKFLWDRGFDGDICIADVILIFKGFKIPSRTVYAYIRAYLTGRYQVVIDNAINPV